MAKLKLKTIVDGKDKNRYCGPSVISALTDLTTGEAARLIRKQSGRKTIKGTYTREVREALRACNIVSFGVKVEHPKPTLARWLKLSKADRTPGRVFLISAGHHWQLVSGRRYTCGRIRDIVSIRDKRVKRRARVREVWELKSNKVTQPYDIDVSKPKSKSKSNPAYYQIRKLIKQYPEFGLTYEIEERDYGGSTYYCTGMSDELEDLACEMDYDLVHGCRGIDEVLWRMEEMVAFANEHYPTINKQ